MTSEQTRTVKTILSRISAHPLYALARNLREIWILGLFYLTVIGFPFSRPELAMEYRVERLYPPLLTATPAGRNHANHIVDSNEPAELVPLLSSRDLMRLTIQNNTGEAIKDIILQVDAFSVAGVAFHSASSRLMADRAKLAAFESSEDFTVEFPNLTTIPPKAKVDILIWGDIETFMWRHPVRIESTAESTRVREKGLASGFGLFIASRSFLLAIILAVGLLLIGLRRYGRA